MALAQMIPGTVAASPNQGNGSPNQWNCSQVKYAQPLQSDSFNGQTVQPAPDPRGRWVPVVMVHGWTGRGTHSIEPRKEGAFSKKIDLTPSLVGRVDVQRSMIGQIQTVPGAAVFTFDYHDYSGRWVSDGNIGPKLGNAIDCLYQASGGEKVIVVAHSMGGLATRYALNKGVSRADKVSSVITMGTPNTGSLIARLIAETGSAVADAMPIPVSTVLRALMAACSTATTISIDRAGLCANTVGAFDGAAGRALRTDSTELDQLAPFPQSVNVHALAADATVKVAALGWFGLRFGETDAPMGDFVVGTDSARADSDTTKLVRCDYRFDVAQGPGHAAVTQIKIAANQEAPADLFAIFDRSACFHSNLPRTIDLTAEATGIIDDDITARLGKWTDPVVTVTTNAIGAAKLGMTDEEIETAANVQFIISCTQCDGSPYVDLSPAEKYPWYSSSTVGVNGTRYRQLQVTLREGQSQSSQVVVTAEGFRLGGSVQELQQIYGDRLQPYRAIGMFDIAGYSIAGPGGYIIFNAADSNGRTVNEFWVQQYLPPTR